MSITIGKLISQSKGGHQYGIELYVGGDLLPQSLKFESVNLLHIGDYVLGQCCMDESSKHVVFRYEEPFAPNNISHWLAAFSIEKERGGNPLFAEIVSKNTEQIQIILKQDKESLPFAVMVLEWGCNHIDTLSDHELCLLLTSYSALCGYIEQIKYNHKQMGLAIIQCISFINAAWDKDWFSSEKNLLLKVHTLDKLIPRDKNAINEIGIKEDVTMAEFYARRINQIASNGAGCSLEDFVTKTPALHFVGKGSDYAGYLSSDANSRIGSIFNMNGPKISNLISHYTIEDVKHYFAEHQDDLRRCSEIDLVQRLTEEPVAPRIDFIRETYSFASKSLREAYLNLMLKTELVPNMLDDYIAVLQDLYSEDMRLDEDVKAANAKAICRYFCDNVASHVNLPISPLAFKLWRSVKWDLTFDEQVDYLKCGLLNRETFISSAQKQSDTNLFALWQSCRSKDVEGVLEGILQDREKRWTDWNSGIELYKARIFRYIPLGLLFRSGTPKDMIVAELGKLKLAEYIKYLVSYTDRKLASEVATILWNRVLKTAKCSKSAAPIDTKVFMSRYLSKPNDELFVCLLNDWAGDERKALKSFIAGVLRDSVNRPIAKRIKALFGQDKYVPHSEVERFICENKQYFDTLLIAQKLGLSELITDACTADICRDLPGLEKHREKSNRKFIKNHLREPLAIRGHELIEEQKKAIICDEDNILVVNSAGGGKSTLIEAKARYLINTHNVSPKDILVLAFNHSVAEELAGKMKDIDVECGTFHAVAQGILARKNGYKPSFFEPKDGLAVFLDLMSTDPQFKRVVFDYAIATSYDGLKAPYEYESEEDYQDAVNVYNHSKHRKKYLDKLFAAYKDMDGRTVACRSIQECEICDFLGSHGIPFKYERLYEHQIYNTERKPYRPDFAIYKQKGDETPLLYIEHIGIDKDGKCAPGIDVQKYEEKRAWAQNIHKSNNTILLETTGAEFDNHIIFTNLARKLKKYGVDLSQTAPSPYFKDDFSDIGDFCVSYVSLLKSSCQSFIDIKKKVQSKDDQYFLDKMISRFIDEYERIKKGKDDKIDFDDAILEATKMLNDGIVQQTYKYILIDEFQDISIARHRFVKALRESETKLFCVGDDWQSIYRFGGSDLSLFADFELYTGYAARIEAGTTFRFGDPARKVSTAFINKSMPCGKKVKQYEINKVTEIDTLWYENDPVSLIESILDNVLVDDSDNYNDEKRIPKVIFLARNSPKKIKAFPYFSNHSTLKITHKRANRGEKYYVSYKGRDLPFYSIHAVKGLEAENVIVLNCNDGEYGIPSRVSESPLLQYVLSKPDVYPYAEERRLFYVALTRATKKTWLLYDKNHPSPFVREIQEIISKR